MSTLLGGSGDGQIDFADDAFFAARKQYKMNLTKSGWPHSSQDKIPCVFPVLDNFSLCYFMS